MKLETFLDKYQDRIWEDCGDKHKKDSVHRVRQLIATTGNIEYEQLTADHVFKLMDKLRACNCSQATINRYVAAISALMRFARRIGFSTKRFEISTPKEKNRVRYFTPLELKAMDIYCRNKHVPQWFGDMCRVARFTGMRHKEVTRLITMDKVEYELDDKKRLWITLFDTKNGDDRHVALTDKDAIESCLRLRNCKYTEKVFYRLWDEMRFKVARNDSNFVFHVFRHSAASTMANELGLNTAVIGEMLGHRSAETTKKYIHAKKGTIASIADKMAVAG